MQIGAVVAAYTGQCGLMAHLETSLRQTTYLQG